MASDKVLRERFERMRERIVRARARRRALEDALRERYAPYAGLGWEYNVPRGKREHLEKARNLVWDREHRFIDFVASISPRGGRWNNSVPAAWIVEHCTFEDATTGGALHEVPPVPYSGSLWRVRCFASAYWQELAA